MKTNKKIPKDRSNPEANLVMLAEYIRGVCGFYGGEQPPKELAKIIDVLAELVMAYRCDRLDKDSSFHAYAISLLGKSVYDHVVLITEGNEDSDVDGVVLTSDSILVDLIKDSLGDGKTRVFSTTDS